MKEKGGEFFCFSYFRERERERIKTLSCPLFHFPRSHPLKTKLNKFKTTHPQLFATRLIPSVAFFVKTISLSLRALTNFATLARADS